MTLALLFTLDNPAGNQLLSAEVVEYQLAMLPQGAGDFLEGLDPGSHGLAAPLVELCDRLHNSTYVAILLMWPKGPAVQLCLVSPAGAPHKRGRSEAVEKRQQRPVVFPVLALPTSALVRFAGRQRPCFHFQIDLGVNICRVDGDVPHPRANCVDVNSGP